MTFRCVKTATAGLAVVVILCNSLFVTSHSLEVTKDTHDKQAKETCQRGYNVGYYVAEDGTICCNCKAGTFLVADCKPYNFGEPWTTKCEECPFDPDDSDKQYYMPEETNDTQCLKADNEQHCEKMMNTHFEMGNNKTNSRCICDRGYHMASTNITHGCHKDSPCKEGFEPSQRATNVFDTTCRPCPTGEFSDISSPSAMCKPFTLCRPGEFESFAGNSTRDRHCVINTTIQNEPFSQPNIPTSSTEEAGAIEDITGWSSGIAICLYLEIGSFVVALAVWVIMLYRQCKKKWLHATLAALVVWIAIVITTIVSAVHHYQTTILGIIVSVVGLMGMLVICCCWKGEQHSRPFSDVNKYRKWICQKFSRDEDSSTEDDGNIEDSAHERVPLRRNTERPSMEDGNLDSGSVESSAPNAPAINQDGNTHAVTAIQANSGDNPVGSAAVAGTSRVPNSSSSEVAATISSQPGAPNKAGPIPTVPVRIQVEELHQTPIVQDNYRYIGFEEGLQQASDRQILECCMKKHIKDVIIAGLMMRALEKWENKDELHEFLRNCFPDVERNLSNIERKHWDESRVCHEWMMLVIRTYGNKLTPEFIFKFGFQYQKMKDDMTKVFFEQLQPCQSHVGHC